MKSIYSTLADSHGSSCLSISLQRCKYTRHIKSPSNVSKALAPSRPMPVRKDRVTLNMVMKTFLGRSPRKRATCKSRGKCANSFEELSTYSYGSRWNAKWPTSFEGKRGQEEAVNVQPNKEVIEFE